MILMKMSNKYNRLHTINLFSGILVVLKQARCYGDLIISMECGKF